MVKVHMKRGKNMSRKYWEEFEPYNTLLIWTASNYIVKQSLTLSFFLSFKKIKRMEAVTSTELTSYVFWQIQNGFYIVLVDLNKALYKPLLQLIYEFCLWNM